MMAVYSRLLPIKIKLHLHSLYTHHHIFLLQGWSVHRNRTLLNSENSTVPYANIGREQIFIHYLLIKISVSVSVTRKCLYFVHWDLHWWFLIKKWRIDEIFNLLSDIRIEWSLTDGSNGNDNYNWWFPQTFVIHQMVL